MYFSVALVYRYRNGGSQFGHFNTFFTCLIKFLSMGTETLQLNIMYKFFICTKTFVRSVPNVKENKKFQNMLNSAKMTNRANSDNKKLYLAHDTASSQTTLLQKIYFD